MLASWLLVVPVDVELLLELLEDEELPDVVEAVLVDDEPVVPLEPPDVEDELGATASFAWGGTTARMSISILRRMARTRRASVISSCPVVVIRR